jgi:hypothetical protein
MREHGGRLTFSGMQCEAKLALHLPQVVPHEKFILAQIYGFHCKPGTVLGGHAPMRSSMDTLA